MLSFICLSQSGSRTSSSMKKLIGVTTILRSTDIGSKVTVPCHPADLQALLDSSLTLTQGKPLRFFFLRRHAFLKQITRISTSSTAYFSGFSAQVFDLFLRLWNSAGCLAESASALRKVSSSARSNLRSLKRQTSETEQRPRNRREFTERKSLLPSCY